MEQQRARRLMFAVFAAVIVCLLALRLPYLPPTLDDIDSLNFDLGMHDFDPVAFQPHPPGFPVYVFLAKLLHVVAPGHPTALTLMSALFGAALVVPLYLLMRRFTSRVGAAVASAMTVCNPLVWFSSVRPMSDITGLFAVIASQCVLMHATDDEHDRAGIRGRAGAFLAALAIGVRVQAALLVGPLLLYVWLRRRRQRLAIGVSASIGVLLWFVPLVNESGGVRRFVGALGLLVKTALPVEPLFTHWTRQRLILAMRDELFSPWQWKWVGITVVALALVGLLIQLRTNRRMLALIGLLFLPYGVYNYMLQDTATIRYAIPLVPCVALLASIPLCNWKRAVMIGPLLAAGICGVSAMITMPALREYHATPSPPFRALARVRQLAMNDTVLVSGHYPFERYLRRLSDDRRIAVLPPVEHEWLMLADYWKRGERRPILFLRDSTRTTLLSMGRDTQHTLGRWRWPDRVNRLMRGERPGDVELVRLEPPRWFTDSGIAMSLEIAPMAQLTCVPHRLYLRPSERPRAFLASGSLVRASHGDVVLKIEDEARASWTIDKHFTLQALLDPPKSKDRYALTLLEASTPMLVSDVWLGPADQPAIRPAQGFYFAERDQSDATLFRWMAPDARAAVYLPQRRARVTIRGRVPIPYQQAPLRLSFEWEGHPLASISVEDGDFVFQQDLVRRTAVPWHDLIIHASGSFVPQALVGNGDARRVSVQILEMGLQPFDEATDVLPRLNTTRR